MNSTPWSSQPKEEKDISLGTKIRKTFEGYGTFDGVVVDLDTHDLPGGTQRFMYKVKYEDGDSEQLYASQLRPLRDLYIKETGDSGSISDVIRSTAARVHLLGLTTGWHGRGCPPCSWESYLGPNPTLRGARSGRSQGI